ncbi:Regulatory protein YrvL [Priestia megaterium]|nr:Regulatory protein YrvL [Priestia megaterium]
MGVEYESYWAICLFLFLIFVFGSITELFSKALIFLMKNARLNRVLFITSAAFVDIFFTFLSVYIADLLVSGITVSILAVTLLSVLFFLMESALDSEFLRKKTS